MSVKSWKDEFYTQDAADATSSNIEALQHSIKKWKGLSKENRKKHGLKPIGKFGYTHYGHLVDKNGDDLGIDATSCALCKIHIASGCEDCPLKKEMNSVCTAFITNPYGKYIQSGDNKPMLDALKNALKKELKLQEKWDDVSIWN